jgi:hypothetical protein
MDPKYDVRSLEVGSLGPEQSGDTEVFSAPTDFLLANVVYTPADDIYGSFERPRFIHLGVREEDDRGGRPLADASPQGDNFYLPAGVGQNLPLWWTNRLAVREGESLYWTSRVLRDRPGVPDPGGTVEVVLEPRSAPGIPWSGWDWREYVPDYWINRYMWVTYRDRPQPEIRSGVVTYGCTYSGLCVEATDRGILVDAETPEALGKDIHQTLFRYEQIDHIKLH